MNWLTVKNAWWLNVEPYEWEALSDKEKAAQPLTLKVSLYDDLKISVAEVFEDMIESWEWC